MMQQIATLQTDIAAKPSTDLGLGNEQAFVNGSSTNQPSQGEQFGDVLRDQKQMQGSQQPTQKKESTSEPNSVSKTEKTVNNSSAEVNERNTADSSVKATESKDAAVVDKPAAEITKDPLKDDIESQDVIAVVLDNATGAEQETIVEDLITPSSEDVSWIDFVEKIKTLNEQRTSGQQTSDDSAWDGEVAELKVIDDDIGLKQSELLDVKVAEISVPIAPSDELTADDGAVEQIALWLKQLNGDDTSPIPNDLFVVPVDSVDKTAESQDVIIEPITLDDTTQKLVTELLAVQDEIETQLSDRSIIIEDVTIQEESPIVVLNPAISPKVDTGMPEVKVKADLSPSALVDQLTTNETTRELVSESLTQQLQQIVKQPVTESQQKNFIAALQAGVNEYQAQLKQGHEPGISLKALITDALEAANIPADKTDVSAMARVTEQTLQASVLTDALKSARLEADVMAKASLQHVEAAHDVTVQTDTQRSVQSAVLDKPANILKPEGQTQFAEKIRWMVNARNSFAEIRLDPPELGSVQVKVAMSGEAAAINFVVQSPQARDALDQALPRLREMLNQQGIELGQSSVQQEQQQQQDEQQQQSFTDSEGDDAMEEVAGEVIEQRVVNGSAGGIDFYA